MADPDYLAAISRELVTRIRDDDPEENGRWLAAVLPDPADWFRLVFVTGALVPDDRTWSQLTAWIPGGAGSATPRQPCGTHAAAARHRRRKEKVCDACLRAERPGPAAWAGRNGHLKESA